MSEQQIARDLFHVLRRALFGQMSKLAGYIFLIGASLGVFFFALSPSAGVLPVVPCQEHSQCQAALKQEHAVCLPPRLGADPQCYSGLSEPPPVALLAAAALSRNAAAADLLWVRTLQFIGSHHAELVEYSGLQEWVSTILKLRPEFKRAPLMAATLVSTIPNQAETTLRLLDEAEPLYRGHRKYWRIFFWRATTYEYILLDVKNARPNYKRAAELGGPSWLKDRAETLESETVSCATLKQRLMQTFTETGGENSARALTGKDAFKAFRGIYIHCVESELKRAEASHQLTSGRTAETVEELVEAGLIEAPQTPPGLKWIFEERIPKLVDAGAAVKELPQNEPKAKNEPSSVEGKPGP